MVKKIFLGLVVLMYMACSRDPKTAKRAELESSPIEGTWKLTSAVNIMNGDSSVTDYSLDVEGIKIINRSHFAFFQHDLSMGKDSVPVYSSGGGKYLLEGDRYTEYLEYCNAREWENHKFEFTVEVNNDTLIQTGIEKIPSLDVDRVIIETYVKTNNKNTPIPIVNNFEEDEITWFSKKGSGIIKGVAKFKSTNEEIRYGSDFWVELMPFTPYTQERLKHIYQNGESGFVNVKDGLIRAIPDPEGYHKTIKVMCDENGEFELDNLPGGDYYVIAFMLWDERTAEGDLIKDGGGIMKRILLGEGEKQTIELVNF